MQPSPYTPGKVARETPGRGQQLVDADERLSYMIDLGRLVDRIRVDHAARGVGKTSLLRQVEQRAQQRGALTVWVTAGEQNTDLITAIGDAIERQTRTWRDTSRIRRALEHMKLTVGIPGVAQLEVSGAGDARGETATHGAREFENLLIETAATARDEGRAGLVAFIDEIQGADPVGLRTLAYAWQHLQSEAPDLRAAVFAAGLPNSPETLAAAVTFSERLFAYRHLDYLDEQATRLALAGPAAATGVRWDNDALHAAEVIADGYPYFVQLVGEAAWKAAGHPDPGATITAAHVRRGQATMREDQQALYRARWLTASPLEQRIMAAMAELGDGPVSRADVARILDASPAQLSVPRQRLLDKGLIEVPERGTLAFPIPGFAAYIRERQDAPTSPTASGGTEPRTSGPTPQPRRGPESGPHR